MARRGDALARKAQAPDGAAENGEKLAPAALTAAACDESLAEIDALRRANAQLRGRLAEVGNLLASSPIVTLCLDRDCRIRWVSPNMNTIAALGPGDIGRPIAGVSAAGLGDDLLDEAQRVLATLQPTQRELETSPDRWHLRRIVPLLSDGDRIGGVVVTYADISEAKRSAREMVAAQRAMAASLEDRVRQRTAQLRMLTAELVLTEERERRLLARDLHDDLGQTLAIVKIKLTSLEESERRGALKRPLQEIEALIDQANRSARSLMVQLSPPALQALGLLPALEWLGEEMERSYGLSVDIDSEGEIPPLEEPARTTVFRAVRELLINVAKHAGTNCAQINCQCGEDGQLSISVTDQGVGFDSEVDPSISAKDSGFGLLSVRERIELIGGALSIDTQPGYGATITIVYPADKSVA